MCWETDDPKSDARREDAGTANTQSNTYCTASINSSDTFIIGN